MHTQSLCARRLLDIIECCRLSDVITIKKLRIIIMCAIHAGHGTHTIALHFIQLTSDLLSKILALAQEHYSLF